MAVPPLPLLHLHQLCCWRGGRFLFEDLHCRLEQGQCLALRGSNGSGKSTLLRIAAGLYRDFEGNLQRSVPVLYLGHTTGLKGALSVRENLHWFCALHAVSAAGTSAALERVGLKGLEDRRVAELSAGQRQRAALARLLLAPAPLWLLDEPFAILDQQGAEMLHDMLTVHTARGGGALIAVHRAAPPRQSSALYTEPFSPADIRRDFPASPAPLVRGSIEIEAASSAMPADTAEQRESLRVSAGAAGQEATSPVSAAAAGQEAASQVSAGAAGQEATSPVSAAAAGQGAVSQVSAGAAGQGAASQVSAGAAGQEAASQVPADSAVEGDRVSLPFSGGSATGIFISALRRDFLLLFREWSALLRPPLFLLAATLLIPLGQGPLPAAWGGVAGLIWAFAFLAMLLAADSLCRDDLQDGSLDQIFIAPGPPWAAALARVLLCWLSAGVTVALTAPVAGLLLQLPTAVLPALVAGLLLGSLPLAALGAAGGALTAGVSGGGLLLPLLLLPLALPVLVFGTAATAAAAQGFSPWPALALLAALSLLALALLPAAVSAGWRISAEL